MKFFNYFQNPNNNNIDKKVIFLLSSAQFITLLGLYQNLPTWIFILFVLCILWRYKISKYQIGYPNNYLKVILIIFIVLGVKLSINNFKTLDSFAILLSSAFILKLWEAYNKKDVFIISFTGILCTSLILLFDNSIIFTLYSLLCVFLFLSSLCLLYQENFNFAFQKISIIILQSLPLAIFLFFIIPRIGTLWALPTSQKNIERGLNDEITFQNMQDLALTNHLAFRVEFKNQIPENKNLYFKGFTLNYFNGDKWSNTEKDSLNSQLVEYSQEELEYSILIQPTGQKYLYAISFPQILQNNISIKSDGTLFNNKTLTSPFQYSVKSNTNAIIDKNLNKNIINKYLQLPESNNEKTKELAKHIFQKSNSNEDFINKILDNFQKDNFIYSLKTITVKENALDSFIFENKIGFCAHYAGATTFMLRSVGIPARVVIGYQGGTINNNYLIVSSKDAHAWVEYWTEEHGWKMIDPTAYVAPNRIELGFDDFKNKEETNLNKNFIDKFNFPFLTKVNLFVDRLNFQWQKFVISYDQKEQKNLFSKFFNQFDWIQFSIIIIITLLSILSTLWLIIEKPFKKKSQLESIYNLIQNKMKNNNIKIHPNATIEEITYKIQQKFPDKKKQLEQIKSDFNSVFYNNQTFILKNLKKQIKKIF